MPSAYASIHRPMAMAHVDNAILKKRIHVPNKKQDVFPSCPLAKASFVLRLFLELLDNYFTWKLCIIVYWYVGTTLATPYDASFQTRHCSRVTGQDGGESRVGEYVIQ